MLRSKSPCGVFLEATLPPWCKRETKRKDTVCDVAIACEPVSFASDTSDFPLAPPDKPEPGRSNFHFSLPEGCGSSVTLRW